MTGHDGIRWEWGQDAKALSRSKGMAQERKAWGREGEDGVQAVERRVLASDQAPAEGSTEGGGGAPAAGAGAGAAKLGPPCSNSPAAPPPKPAGHRLPLVRVLMDAPFTDDWTLEPAEF